MAKKNGKRKTLPESAVGGNPLLDDDVDETEENSESVDSTLSQQEENYSKESQQDELIRIGVMLNVFSISASIGHQTSIKYFTKFNAGQIIREQELIDKLLDLKAPIEVYYRYADRCAKR